MRNKSIFCNILCSITFVMIFVFFTSINVKAAEYDYPIKKGTPAWKEETKNRGVLKEKLQIPEEFLKTMTTEELVETVLNYPCFDDLYFYDSKQTGFEQMKKSFNGIQELFSRQDCAKILLNKYVETNNKIAILRDTNEESSNKAYEFICLKSNIEVLLAQPQINDQLNFEDREIMEDLLSNSYQKNGKDSNFISYKQNTYEEIKEEQSNSKSTKYVTTPNGSKVEVFSRGEQISQEDKYWMRIEVLEQFPGVSVVSDGTTRYNCHSFAWYSMNTSTNNYWMNDPSPYMKDGSYKKVSLSTRKFDDRIWFSGVHSAVVNKPGQTNDMVSKWGDYPLVSHSLTNNPYYASPLIIEAYRR